MAMRSFRARPDRQNAGFGWIETLRIAAADPPPSDPAPPARLPTLWTPLRREAVPSWGARALPPGPTMLTARD